jgi:hypothetical protein
MQTVNELIPTLNEHQKAYINMDLKDPKNGDYMLCAFHLVP